MRCPRMISIAVCAAPALGAADGQGFGDGWIGLDRLWNRRPLTALVEFSHGNFMERRRRIGGRGVCEAASAIEAIQKYLAKDRLEDLNKITVERMPAIDNVVGLTPSN